MFCTNCGTKLQEGVKFCVNCGTKLGADAPSGAIFKPADEIEYTIFGEEMQLVEIALDQGESVIAEAGGMTYMEKSIKMETIFGDGSGADEGKGFMGKLASAGKRVITGESLFMTTFQNMSQDKAHVAFAAPYPGKIIPVDLKEFDGTIICQKDAFLCAAKGVNIGIHFQRKLGAGLFGGEGFIMQKLTGDGLVFLHAGGTIIKKELADDEMLRLDTGCLVAMSQTVDYDVQLASDIKTGFFGGEGLFLATLRGPGQVWLQSLPLSRLANRISQARHDRTGENKGINNPLGEITGGLGGLFK